MKLSSDELKGIATHSFQLMGHNNKFVGLDALLVWQYIRFNKKYKRDYLALKEAHNQHSEDDDYCDSLVQAFCSCWCVPEPVDFNLEKVPTDFYFEYRLVRKIESFARERYLFDWNSDPSQPELVLAINTRADRRLVLKEIESYLDGEKNDWAKDRLRPNTLAHLSDNFLCFYLKEVSKLNNTQIKHEYKKVFPGGDLQDSQLKDKIDSFSNVAARAPWCFFAATQ